MNALPASITARDPGVSHAMALAAQVRDQLRTAGMRDIDVRNPGNGLWIVSATFKGQAYRITVEREVDAMRCEERRASL